MILELRPNIPQPPGDGERHIRRAPDNLTKLTSWSRQVQRRRAVKHRPSVQRLRRDLRRRLGFDRMPTNEIDTMRGILRGQAGTGELSPEFSSAPRRPRPQLNSDETLSSLAMRPIASPIRGAIEMTRMLRATLTASVGVIVSVSMSSVSFEAAMRATAPPDRTPWVI